MPTISTLTIDVQTRNKATAGLKSAGIALAGLGAAAVVTFKAFEDSEKVTAQTNAVIESTGSAANVTTQQVIDLASALSEKSGVDDEVIQSGENMLLTFKNIQNSAGKNNDIFNQASSVTLDMASAMAAASGSSVDLKGASIQIGKALNDPVKGLTALTRVGVTFTDQQTKQIEQMVKSGDTLGAQKVILKELTSEFGGSAEANKTASMETATAFGNLQEAIGGVVANGITPLLAAAQPLITFLTNSPGLTAGLVIGITAIFIATKLWAFWTNVLSVATERQILLQKFLWLTNPYVLIAAAIVALVVIVVKNWATIKRVILAVWAAVKRATVVAFDAVKGVVIGVFNWFKRNWPLLLAILAGPFGLAVLAIVKNWEKVKTFFLKIKDFFRRVFDGVKGVILGAWDAIVGGIKSAVNAIIGAINFIIGGWNNIIGKVNSIPGVPDIPSIPEIPTLAKGGWVGRTGLAVVHEGERFSGVGGGWGGVTVNVYGSVISERDLAATVQKELLKMKRRSGALGLA